MEKIRQFIDKITRPSRKVLDFIPFALLLSLFMMLGGVLIFTRLLYAAGLKELILWLSYDYTDVADFMQAYADFIGIWIIVLLTVVIFKANRRMLKSFWYNHKGNTLKGYLIGLLLGFGANGFCILMSVLMNDIKLSYAGIDLQLVLSFFIAVMIQSGAEELIDRFYLYQKLRRRYRSPLVAILVNSIVFTLLHAANPGFGLVAALQIFFVAIIFSMLVYYYDGLWIAIAFHTAWNYCQSIVFGLPNSGIVSAYSIFRLEAASATNGFFYNVNFGVEGSVGAVIVLIAIGIAIYILNKGKPERTDLWKETEQ